MGKGKIILLTLIIVFALASVLAIFKPNALTGFLINDTNLTSQTIIPYVVVIITLILIAVYSIKFLFSPNLMTNSLRPAEALESLLLDFERAKSKGDKESAKAIAHKVKHLYDHLIDEQKLFFKSRISSMEKYIS